MKIVMAIIKPFKLDEICAEHLDRDRGTGWQ